MHYKLFPLKISLYLIVIILSAYFAVILAINFDKFATAFLLLIISVLFVISLYHMLNRVNRDLSSFLLSIKNDDLTQKFSRPLNPSFQKLYDAFHMILNKIHDERSESVDQYYLLQMVIEHIKVAMISFKMDGEVDIYNQSARVLFGIPYLTKVDDLIAFDSVLVQTLKELNPNKRKLLKIQSSSGQYQLAIEITEFKQHSESYRLASIQNIKEELDQQEIDSWQKLIRVLNHEVFNSITPIISLSESTKEIISQEGEIKNEDRENINKAFETIERRGKNLLEFVDRFRSISHLPSPVFKSISVNELIRHIITLQKAELKDHNISCEFSIDPQSIEITIDRGMIEQVLINLFKNAIQALHKHKNPEIKVHVAMHNTHISISIADNGSGISDESIDKIFIPFYSTKANGSGIGLSLSRQIMALHKGEIQVESSDSGSTFILNFFY